MTNSITVNFDTDIIENLGLIKKGLLGLKEETKFFGDNSQLLNSFVNGYKELENFVQINIQEVWGKQIISEFEKMEINKK